MFKFFLFIVGLFISFPMISQKINQEEMDESVLNFQNPVLYAQAIAQPYVNADNEAGENQEYNLTFINQDLEIEISYLDIPPNDMYGAENFGNATHVLKTQAGSFSQVVQYIESENDQWQNLGNWNNTTGSEQVQICSDALIQYEFPIQYNSSWSDKYACEAQAPFTGFQSNVTGSYDAIVDSYGTLFLPSGTFEGALRIKFTEEGETTSFFDGQELSSLSYSKTTFQWVKPGYPFPLSTYSNIIYNEEIPELQGGGGVYEWTYILADPLSYNFEEQLLSAVKVFPNPANSYIELSNLEVLAKEAITYEIVSLNGEIVQNGSLDRSTNQSRLDVSHLSSGFYALKLYIQDASATKKLIIN